MYKNIIENIDENIIIWIFLEILKKKCESECVRVN